MLSKTVVFLVMMVALAGTAHAQVAVVPGPDQRPKQYVKNVDPSAIAARLRSGSMSAIKIVSPLGDWSLSTDALGSVTNGTGDKMRVSTLASIDRALPIINRQARPIFPPEMAVGFKVTGNVPDPVRRPIGSEVPASVSHVSTSRFASLRAGLPTNGLPIATAPISALNLPIETSVGELRSNGVNGLHGVKSAQRAMNAHAN